MMEVDVQKFDVKAALLKIIDQGFKSIDYAYPGNDFDENRGHVACQSLMVQLRAMKSILDNIK